MKDEKSAKKSFAAKVFVYFVSFTLLLLVIHLVLQYLNLIVYDEKAGQLFELTNRFDLNDESSFPTWVSQFMFLIVAAGAGLIALLERKSNSYRIWIIISLAALLGSIDEVSTFHESILQAVHVLFFQDAGSSNLSNAWLLITPLVLIIVVLFLHKAIKVLPKKTLKLLVLTLIPYLFGSIVIDMLTNNDLSTSGFFDQGIMVGIEETLELLGLTIAIYAVVDYLETYHKKQITESINHLIN